MLSHAAMDMGVALTLHVRAARKGPANGADQAPAPHIHSSASACLDDRVREAAQWLQAAFDGGPKGFDVGQKDAALADLREHLSWRAGRRHVDAHVQRLPCSEVLQLRSPKGGFEKSRIGRESEDRAAQGNLWNTQQVARGCQRRCGA
jgi:hypothetical protein